METPSKNLNAPKTPPKSAAAEDITSAYVQAVVSLPEILDSIAASLEVLALYFEKRGIEEKRFTEEDLRGDD